MMIIGITGISGSGKTQATRILSQMGGYTIEADPLAHATMKKGQQAYVEILETFGPNILYKDGEIHRPALGALVFSNKENLRKLEAIIHPKVAEKITIMLAEAKNSNLYNFAVIDAPLLIEANLHKICHSVWLITASHETRLKRIIARDNITTEAAEKRLASRPGDEALKPYADIIIENNGNSLEDLGEKIAVFLKNMPDSPVI